MVPLAPQDGHRLVRSPVVELSVFGLVAVMLGFQWHEYCYRGVCQMQEMQLFEHRRMAY